jgi:hypothetical protein
MRGRGLSCRPDRNCCLQSWVRSNDGRPHLDHDTSILGDTRVGVVASSKTTSSPRTPTLRIAVEIGAAAAPGPGELPADLRRQNRILLDSWFILRYPWQVVAHDWRRVHGELREAWELRSVVM